MNLSTLIAKGVLPYTTVECERVAPAITRRTRAWTDDIPIIRVATDTPVSADPVVHILDVKARLRASKDETEALAGLAARLVAQEMLWAGIGTTIILGLVISVLGSALHFVSSGPLPFAIAAFGMLLVIFALAYGGRIQKQQSARRVTFMVSEAA